MTYAIERILDEAKEKGLNSLLDIWLKKCNNIQNGYILNYENETKGGSFFEPKVDDKISKWV